MLKDIIKNTRLSYDVVAAEYAEKMKDEMDSKPFDRACLDRLICEVDRLGPICDLGCGPGQIARYLHRQGAETLGMDLSPQMVEIASQINPGIPFHEGNMLALPEADSCWGGIAAFYCIIHIPPQKIVMALREMKRVLKPGGILLIAFHTGSKVEHLDEWWGKKVNVDFHYYQPEQMEDWLKKAGFELLDALVRDPDPQVEVATVRAYVFARKPALSRTLK